jgi:hypothetical protein
MRMGMEPFLWLICQGEHPTSLGIPSPPFAYLYSGWGRGGEERYKVNLMTSNVLQNLIIILLLTAMFD